MRQLYSVVSQIPADHSTFLYVAQLLSEYCMHLCVELCMAGSPSVCVRILSWKKESDQLHVPMDPCSVILALGEAPRERGRPKLDHHCTVAEIQTHLTCTTVLASC
jgi:hypothetical protein